MTNITTEPPPIRSRRPAASPTPKAAPATADSPKEEVVYHQGNGFVVTSQQVYASTLYLDPSMVSGVRVYNRRPNYALPVLMALLGAMLLGFATLSNSAMLMLTVMVFFVPVTLVLFLWAAGRRAHLVFLSVPGTEQVFYAGKNEQLARSLQVAFQRLIHDRHKP